MILITDFLLRSSFFREVIIITFMSFFILKISTSKFKRYYRVEEHEKNSGFYHFVPSKLEKFTDNSLEVISTVTGIISTIPIPPHRIWKTSAQNIFLFKISPIE